MSSSHFGSCMKKSTQLTQSLQFNLFSSHFQRINHFHTNSGLQYGRRQRKPTVLKSPKPDIFAPSPFARFPHRATLTAADHERQQAFDHVKLNPEQKIAIFPSYRKIALKIESVATTPTTTLEFYVDQRMTKPEIKMWLETLYNLKGIEKIHTSTHTRKRRRHRLNIKRKLPLPIRKKVYVELDHEIDFVTPRNDDLPFFDADVVEEVSSRSSRNLSSLALNWHNRRWLKEVNPPSKGLHVHRSRHKLIREEMNKRLIVQKTLNQIEELQRRVQKIQEEDGRLGPSAGTSDEADETTSRVGAAAGGALPTISDTAFNTGETSDQVTQEAAETSAHERTREETTNEEVILEEEEYEVVAKEIEPNANKEEK